MCCGINVLHVYILRHTQMDRCIIQDRLYPCLHKLIGHFLCSRRRHCQHRHPDLVLLDLFRHHIRAEDLDTIHLVADFLGVILEQHCHMKATVHEPVVTRQRMSHIAHAHDDHIPNAVHLQDTLQTLDQERDRIPCPLLAELAEL